MNILFICGDLEPGRDGVGDYSRRLGGELVRQGHQVSILALYDGHIKDEKTEVQLAEGVEIHVLRIPHTTSNKRRFSISKHFIQLQNPEWISLQYVPYSFHKKGLPIKLAANLAVVGSGRKWHVMFHELWVGNENFKNRVISTLQKWLIKNLLRSLKPIVVHTHLPDYYLQLKGVGQNAKELILFSNIPVVNSPIKKSSNQFTMAFFSQAEVSKELLSFLATLQGQLVEAGKEVKILFIGGSATKMKSVGDAIEEDAEFKNNVNYTGYLLPHEISACLQNSDLGITPLPLVSLGKSGSVAAFLAHQIPVAVPVSNSRLATAANPFFYSTINEALLLDADLFKLPLVTNAAKLASSSFDLGRITQKFIADLS